MYSFRTWTLLLLGCAISSVAAAAEGTDEWLARVDHLVYATPDLNRGIDEIEKLLGIRATPGGQHPGRGTRNALVALGPNTYLEIIGPDPGQAKPTQARRFGIDKLTQSRLAGWAAHDSELERLTGAAVQNGVDLGPVKSGSRRRPDGVLLSWRYTNTAPDLGDGLVPFFIDWEQSPHPARTAATGATLVALRAEHPNPQSVARMLRQLGLGLAVQAGPAPALIAVIDSPRGRVELR